MTYKAGKPGIPAYKSSYRKQLIDELIEWDTQRKKAMSNYHLVKATIHAQHAVTGLRVEVGIECENIAGIHQAIADMSNSGFKAIVNASKPDNINKIGTVKSVARKPDGKTGFDVTIALKDGGEQKLTAFKASEYRVGDMVKITKNDKGFYEGVLLTEPEEQPAADNSDIPF